MMAGCWVERRLTEMSERDAIEVTVHPKVIKLKELKFKCLYIIFLPKIFYSLHYYY